MPTIGSSTELLNHINSGSSFALTENGGVKTQGFFGWLFQKISDAFHRVTPQQLQARQNQLDSAMAGMLRNVEALPNLKQLETA